MQNLTESIAQTTLFAHALKGNYKLAYGIAE